MGKKKDITANESSNLLGLRANTVLSLSASLAPTKATAKNTGFKTVYLCLVRTLTLTSSLISDNYFTSPIFIFLIFKMGLIIMPT